jgi:short subunit dehydrogenase-like uncharacterized protein
MKWLIYGANGYSGALIAREAQARGLRPILGGRSTAVRVLAAELGLESRQFSLTDPTAVQSGLAGVGLVLHCAGPFSVTAPPMVDGCLAAGAHYLDITGEIAVFEAIYARHAEARLRGVVLCPGVGFDVVPTDCLALALKARMPDASHLSLGFDSRSSLSPGTAKTSLEALAAGGQIRALGHLRAVPLAWKTRDIDFGGGPRHAMTIPWGDIASAWRSTGIPDIDAWIPASPRMVRRLRWLNALRPLLALPWLQRLLKSRLADRLPGPGAEERRRQVTWVWGEVRNAAGQVCSARIRTANGYALTVNAALAIAEALLAGLSCGPGAYTPGQLFGPTLIERLPGSIPITFQDS